MAEFPPDLDDGELWLPSEIIPDVGVRCRGRRHLSVAGGGGEGGLWRADLSYVEDLAQKLAAFGLLDRAHLVTARKPPANLSPHLQEFGGMGHPAAGFGPAGVEAGAGLLYDGFRLPASRPGFSDGGHGVGSLPLNQLRVAAKAAQPQVERFGGLERGRVYPRQPLVQAPPQLHFTPVRSTGPRRECLGTGVFLPRVIDNDFKKKPSVKGRAGKQGIPYQPPSELGLPPEWTY